MPERALTYEQRAHRRAFGESVRQQRGKRGWTQEDLAEHADIHRSYVAALESGQRNPTLDVIVKIASGLHISVADLFT